MKESLRKKIKSQSCVVCHSPVVDPCHIRSKGAGGPDEEWNLIPMCRREHTLQHRIGWVLFMKRYTDVRDRLKSMGWEVRDVLGIQKISHPKLEKGE